MKIRLRNELLPLNLLVVLLIAGIMFFPSNVIRIILGLPFVLFFPGYVLMAALFPKREAIGSIERLTLSLVMSLALVTLIGLSLNITPWGIRLESILYSVASFIVITSVITCLRRRLLPEAERFSIEFQPRMPAWGRSAWGGDAWNRVASVILAVAILGALGVMSYLIATPKAEQKFTEFYILGLEYQAADYPKELKAGHEGRVIICTTNHEYEMVSYRIEVRINGNRDNELGPIVLEHNEKWESEISFMPERAGEKQKVEFFLYKNGEVEPYLEPLRLWLDVTE